MVDKTIIHIPLSARVFVLEDSPERIKWFMDNLEDWTFAKTASAAIDILKTEPPFDFIFLDHDLGLLDYGGGASPEGNGQRVAECIASEFKGSTQRGGNVLVHSWNRRGAEAIKAILPDARICPFGQFRVMQHAD